MTRYSITIDTDFRVILLPCSIPIFYIGLTGEITKQISVRTRLFYAVLCIACPYLLHAKIAKLNIPGIDFLFSIPLLDLIVIIFTITGLANAHDIIDGFHGLSSIVGIITLLAVVLTSVV